jgi:DNA-directed RNA polymerase specialized sigma24 family protein
VTPRPAPRRPESRQGLAEAIAALAREDRLVLALGLLEGLSALESGLLLKIPSHEIERRLEETLRRLVPPGTASTRPGRRAA